MKKNLALAGTALAFCLWPGILAAGDYGSLTPTTFNGEQYAVFGPGEFVLHGIPTPLPQGPGIPGAYAMAITDERGGLADNFYFTYDAPNDTDTTAVAYFYPLFDPNSSFMFATILVEWVIGSDVRVTSVIPVCICSTSALANAFKKPILLPKPGKTHFHVPGWKPTGGGVRG